MASFDPGEMTARLTLSRPVAVSDGQGGAVVTHEAVAALWARIVPLAAAIEERAGAELVTLTHRIWIRHRADMQAGMRLEKGARRFAVKSAHDPDETRRFLVLSCEEEGP